jgi:hypothetical protein
MALAEHGSSSDVGSVGLLDGQPHGAFVGDVAKSPVAIDNRCRRRFPHDRPRRARHDVAGLDAVDVAGNLDDAVRIMPDQVGLHAVPHHRRRFLRRRAGRDQQRLADALQTFRGNLRHFPLPRIGRRILRMLALAR